MSATAISFEQRQFSRIPLHRPGFIELFQQRERCELLDISLRGARLHVPASLSAGEGEICKLTVLLDGADAAIQMNGMVAHRRGEQLAVRWHRIDLDSLSYLRRILELNLGDDRMVSRELARLARERQPER